MEELNAVAPPGAGERFRLFFTEFLTAAIVNNPQSTFF